MIRTLAGLLAAAVLAGAGPATAQAEPAVPKVPAGDQFLFGSGEAAALSLQTWRALAAHALEGVATRPADSVILAETASLAVSAFVPCEDKPVAAVFDVDETVALNSGLIRSRIAGRRPAPGVALAVRPVPGAAAAIRELIAAGITPIYNTNRTLDMADQVASTIEGFGLPRPVTGETLFLNGMDALGGNKDGRRLTIAARWCVVAMAGDQLGDFSELLKAVPGVADRRAATLARPIEALWGNGWFMLPNTSYGTALEGSLGEVFPDGAPANDN